MSEISVVPINMIDHQVLTRLALCLEERFLATCIVRASLPIPKTALNSVLSRPTIYAICRDLVIVARSTVLENLNHSEAVLIDALRSVANLTPHANNFVQVLLSN